MKTNYNVVGLTAAIVNNTKKCPNKENIKYCKMPDYVTLNSSLGGILPTALVAFSNKSLPYIRWYDCV